MTADNIKSMQLYPRAERIWADLAALGYSANDAVPVEVLNRFDQLHYHGTEALDAAIEAGGIKGGARVLEVGSGWGGCARYIAQTTQARIKAVELQSDYHAVAQELTRCAGLADHVEHINADFLDWASGEGEFDHVISWLALFHIPDRSRYLSKISASLRPGGSLMVEDLYLREAPPLAELAEFQSHLFPNSLVPFESYTAGLAEAGLEVVELDDMTEDWSAFTAERLEAFRGARAGYEAVHGAPGYEVIETFYDKMASYFAKGWVGGVRFAARRRA